MGHSLFTDSEGIVWNIQELMASNPSCETHKLSVRELLTPLLTQQRWGEKVGTVKSVIELVQTIQGCTSEETPIQDSNMGHATRIASLVSAISEGKHLEPIVLGLDSTLWDGIHRLAAFSILGIEWIEVIDLSTYSRTVP
jgi:hypothetical protein